MKKNYFEPETHVILIQTENSFLTGSNENYELGNPFIGGFEDDVVFIF